MENGEKDARELRRIRGRIVKAAALWALLAGGPLLAVSLAAGLEAKVFPVYEDVRITDVSWRDGRAVLKGDLRVARDCDYLGKHVFAGDPGDPAPERERLATRALNDSASPEPIPGESRARWGPIEIAPPSGAAGPALFLRFVHRCHPLYTTHGVYLEAPLDAVFEAPPP